MYKLIAIDMDGTLLNDHHEAPSLRITGLPPDTGPSFPLVSLFAAVICFLLQEHHIYLWVNALFILLEIVSYIMIRRNSRSLWAYFPAVV
jgi:hypothetical protein